MTLESLLSELDRDPGMQSAIDQAASGLRDDFDANGFSVLNPEHVRLVLLGVLLSDEQLRRSEYGLLGLALALGRYL